MVQISAAIAAHGNEFGCLKSVRRRSRKRKRKHRRKRVDENAGEMVAGRVKSIPRIVPGVGHALDGTVEIGGGGIGKEKVPETFGNQAPGTDERITLDEGGVVPDKAVAQGRGINREGGGDEANSGGDLEEKGFQRRGVWRMKVEG